MTSAAHSALPIGSRPRSIQFWLGRLVVACVLPAALAAAFLILRSYERERQSLETSTVVTARALAQVVDQDLAIATAALQALAASDRLASGDLTAFQAQARQVLLARAGNAIVLTDPTGQQIMSTFVPYGGALPHAGVSDLLRVILDSAAPSVSDLYFGAVSGKSQVAVGVPVLRDGTVIDVLTMGILPDRLGDILRDQHLPPGWVVSIFDGNGTIVARTHAPDQFVGKKGATDLLRRMAEIPEGTLETDTLEGVPVRASFSRSAISGWTVAIGIPTATLVADLRQDLLLNAAAAVLLLMSGTLLARTISRRISRSIRALTASASTFGQLGTLPIAPADITEVDALGQALTTAYHLIEQRERERDAAVRGEREMLAAKGGAEAATEAAATVAAQYRGLLEAAPDAMVVVNQGGEIVLLNLQAEKQFGYRRDELVGQTVESIIPKGFAERLLADGLRSTEAALAQQIGTGIELTGRRRDGSEFPIEIMLSPLNSAEGILVTAAIRDTSMRKRTEKHLVQMEGRYRGLLEAAPDAMVVVSQSGTIVLVNLQAEKQFGYRSADLVGQQVKSIIPEGFAERLLADGLRSAEDALAQQIGMGIELSGRRMDGSEFPIEIMLSPLKSAEGILVTAAIRDISMRKDAERHLAQMDSRRRLVEEALRESDERYRLLLDGIQDSAIFVMDRHGQVLSWNAGAERIKGYGADEIIGRNFSCFFPREDVERGRPEEVLRMTAASGRHEEQGMRVRKDGSRFLANVTFMALRDPGGNLRGFSEFSHDLSESKESGAKYRGLLEAAPDAMVVVNQGGEIVLLNVRAENQFGYRRDELVGQQVETIIPQGFAERLLADGLRSAEDALAQQIGTGIELRGQRKDGSAFPIEIMLSPRDSAEGILVTAAIRDISVRKAAEEHLAQMEGRYRGLLEAAPDAMVMMSQGGEIVLLNLQAEKQFGYRRDELVGRKVEDIIPAGLAERLIAIGRGSTDAAPAPQIGTRIELAARRKNGSEFPIEIILGPLECAEGILITAAIRDITTRKKAEAHLLQKVEELNRSNEELAQFAYIASHDLQEPLRMVASYTQLLSKRYRGKLDSDADEFIAFAVDGASRMQLLIQDLLAYSRAGTKGNDLVRTSSEETLRQALMNLRGAIEDSGALVTNDPLPDVLADEMQLIQLFQNLVGNAIKYQSPGIPKVHVSASKGRGQKWVFSVQDNGLGIDPQYFERIFGMFQRLHKREEFAGTGIGLAICKKIVERHGSSITVASQPGQGSTFRFALAEC